MRVYLCCLFLLTLLHVRGDHLFVGSLSKQTQLAHEEQVTYNPIPFLKRVKFYFYTDPHNRPIKAIQALDTTQSKASINITAGGIGQSFVTLRMKSERGYGLDYSIGIYI